MNGNAPRPQEPSTPEPVRVPRASDGGPPRAMASVPPGRAAGGAGSESVAAVLKLASALCALVAVGLFVRPLLLGELSTKPRMLTLMPTFSEEPVEPEESGAPSEPEAAAPEVPVGSTPAPRAPTSPSRGSVTREARAEFDGAILMVESEPSGANVRVDGRDQGETPVSVGLDCLPGKPVVVDITLRGYEKATHTTLCPHDALVKVTASLRKASRSSGKK
ncbi:PEGA domain-containing protein [Archangium violaceum]|uniref:PEGA domain-containing protein n=1 Tax=Archangium violaceum TaxID=83451 RepID=UPI00193B510F|nr:PEGA domain-containing protein [Archangium violaceum]QRK10509.1 PEGA domain-containing protein [Archangium violaceum]